MNEFKLIHPSFMYILVCYRIIISIPATQTLTIIDYSRYTCIYTCKALLMNSDLTAFQTGLAYENV